jgi:hypothetical protein
MLCQDGQEKYDGWLGASVSNLFEKEETSIVARR